MKMGVSNALKRSNEQTFYERVFCFVWIMVIAYLIVRPATNNNTLIRMIWIPSILLIFICSIKRRLSTRLMLEIVAPVCIVFFTIVTSKQNIGIEYILSAFCYVNIFFVVERCKDTTPSKTTFDFIYCCSVALTILFVLYSFTPIAHRVHSNWGVWSSSYFVFDLGNSNLAAMIIFAFYSILLINLAYRERRWLIILLMACDVYLIYMTNCRSVLLTVIAVTASFIFLNRKRIPDTIVFLATLIPAIFIFVFLSLYNSFGNQALIVLNKEVFSGRQNNFTEYLGYLTNAKEYIIGNYAMAGFQNGHNIVVTVLASVGVIGIVCFYAFYNRILRDINSKEVSSVRTICIICILGIFLQSSMEASFFLGGFPGVMFISTFVMLSNYEDYELQQNPS